LDIADIGIGPDHDHASHGKDREYSQGDERTCVNPGIDSVPEKEYSYYNDTCQIHITKNRERELFFFLIPD